MGAVRVNLAPVNGGHVSGHDDVRVETGRRGVGRGGRTGVPGARECDGPDAQLQGARDRDRQPPGLERARRVPTFFLDEELAALEAERLSTCLAHSNERRRAFTQADHVALIAHRQKLSVAPEVPAPPSQIIRLQRSAQRRQVIPRVEHLAANNTRGLKLVCRMPTAAGRALEMRQVTPPGIGSRRHVPRIPLPASNSSPGRKGGRAGAAPVQRHTAARYTSLISTTGLRSTPTPSISTSTTSPGFKYSGGVRAFPIPDGVPVEIKSPGSSVMPFDRW